MNTAVRKPQTITILGDVWRRFRRHRLAVFGFSVLFVFAIAAALAPAISPHNPYHVFSNPEGAYAVWQRPSGEHPLGTDALGRDVLSRLIHGGRVSLSVGLVAVAISAIIGTTLGSLAGYFGGHIDNLVMRFTDVVICFPTLFLIITVSTFLRPNIYNVMAVIGMVSWTGTARLVRAEFLRIRETEFIEAARALGASPFRLIFRHMLPNSLAPIMVASTLLIAHAVLTEAALSFLGVGVQQPIASWGNMLNEALSLTVLSRRWWLWIPPGVAILLTVLSINFLGDGLRDALDPRLKL